MTGNEYIFPNIDDALAYVLDNEQRALAADTKRQTAPIMIRPPFQTSNVTKRQITVDNLDFPLSGYFNSAPSDSFIMSRLASGRYACLLYTSEQRFTTAKAAL